MDNETLVEFLKKEKWLKSDSIAEAFLNIKREDFVPEELKKMAYLNEALPIGYGQTISQPLVVAFMLELLQPQAGEKILDIGAGSGWTTALLAYIVSQKEKKGKVIALEVIPELAEFGKNNTSKYNFIEKGIVKFICQDGSKGYSAEAPFDKILCSASLKKEIPLNWKKQLKQEGRIVTPIGYSIVLIEKKSENEFTTQEFQGFTFVPFITP